MVAGVLVDDAEVSVVAVNSRMFVLRSASFIFEFM